MIQASMPDVGVIMSTASDLLFWGLLGLGAVVTVLSLAWKKKK